MKKFTILLVTHLLALAAGFVLGIYALPILIAPAAPTSAELASQSQNATFSGQFRRDLEGSDLLHWGEGTVSVGRRSITFAGKISPGPDYKLYLSPKFIETREAFNDLKPLMVQVGDIKTFENFIVAVPETVDTAAFNTVVVWCETFGAFITAASYR